MLLKQEIYADKNTRKVLLRNTVDCSAAIDMADDYNKCGGSSNKEYRCIGYIPPEMWNFDPWLLTAKKARAEGDMGQYTKNVQKFFDVHTRFKNLKRQNTFYIGR